MINYQNDHQFYNEYLELLMKRFSYLENDKGSNYNIRLKDNMSAFKYLLENIDKPLTEEMILELGNLVNQSSMYIKDGYRTIGNYSNELNIPISNSNEIKNDIQNLLNDYNNKTDMDPYEREAKFHIRFIRIHPFEDGNRRTARLLLNFNLMKQNLLPIIISKDLEEYYCNYIKEESFEGMTNLFKIQSQKEKNVFEQLQKQYFINALENNQESSKNK